MLVLPFEKELICVLSSTFVPSSRVSIACHWMLLSVDMLAVEGLVHYCCIGLRGSNFLLYVCNANSEIDSSYIWQ